MFIQKRSKGGRVAVGSLSVTTPSASNKLIGYGDVIQKFASTNSLNQLITSDGDTFITSTGGNFIVAGA